MKGAKPRFWQDEDGTWWCPSGYNGRTRCKINVCEECGERYLVSPHVAKQQKYCDRACFGVAHRRDKFAKGQHSPNWKGGRHKVRGYVVVYSPDHPAVKQRPYTKRYMLEHRLVMEQTLGRYLDPHENVHHINGVKDDNRPENLELWSKAHPYGVRAADKLQFEGEQLLRLLQSISPQMGQLTMADKLTVERNAEGWTVRHA